MMNDLSNRLQLSGRQKRNRLPTAIFGSVGKLGQMVELNKPPVRIGLWPIVSETAPETALGLATVLGFLLERYLTVRCYRLFASVAGEPEAYQWSIADSQFSVDDWGLDDLDENAAVWGKLSRAGDAWQLEIEVENDLLDAEVVQKFTYSGGAIPDLIQQLPNAAEDITQYLSAGEAGVTRALYQHVASDHDFTDLLSAAFKHELALFLSLWGQERSLEDLQQDIQVLAAKAQGAGEFGAWLVASAVARDLLFSDNAEDDTFIPTVQEIIAQYPHSPIPAIILSRALFESEQIQVAYDLLEAAVTNHPDHAMSYLTLAELYRSGGRLVETTDTFQAAIEADAVSVSLYLRYANFLQALDFNGISIEDYALVDPEEQDNPLLGESIAAYQAALEIAPDNLEALTALVIQLAEVPHDNPDQIWIRFEQLVMLDRSGEQVRQVVDAFYNQEMLDIEPGITILEKQIALESQRYDLLVNLAVLYLAIEEGSEAETHLKQALQMTDDPDTKLDINRLLLAAEDPEFEMRLGEMTDILNAGNALSADDVNYLEDILARSPGMSEIYLLIARAYLGWDEPSSALETLLDAHKNLPDDPDIAVLLAQTLWEAGEQELAFSYLNAGITANPNHVPLLAVMGQYLFEDEQEEAAKAYLARAERIAPRDPVLTKVRVNIARLFGQ